MLLISLLLFGGFTLAASQQRHSTSYDKNDENNFFLLETTFYSFFLSAFKATKKRQIMYTEKEEKLNLIEFCLSHGGAVFKDRNNDAMKRN